MRAWPQLAQTWKIISDPGRQEPAIDGEGPKMPYQDKAGSQEADGIRSWSLIQ